MGAALDTRHRAKVRQLCDNPSSVDGYAMVVSFATHHVYVKALCTGRAQWYEVWVLHDTEYASS